MMEVFREVLRSNNAGFGLRSIVVEAVAFGVPILALKVDLADLVLRSQSPFSERLYALIALLRIGPDGEAAVALAFHKLGTDTDSLRLRTEIIERMYGERFGPADIIAVLKDVATCTSSEAFTDGLHTFAGHMPLSDIPAVLDGLPLADLATRASHPGEWEVAQFLERVLIRAWRGISDIEPARALGWLRLLDLYSGEYSGSQYDQLRSAILERRDRLSAITDHFFDTLVVDDDRWLKLARFREITLQQVTPAELLAHMRTHLARAPAGSDKELFLFEASFGMAFSMDDQETRAAFEALFALAGC
jgi:hypothetical protein